MHDDDAAPQAVPDEEPLGGEHSPVGRDDSSPDDTPGPGGYAGRDPKTEMPRLPSVPESQDDPMTHDAAPDSKERGAHE